MSPLNYCDVCYSNNTPENIITAGPQCWCPTACQFQEEPGSVQATVNPATASIITPPSSVNIDPAYRYHLEASDTSHEVFLGVLEVLVSKSRCKKVRELAEGMKRSREIWAPPRSILRPNSGDQSSDIDGATCWYGAEQHRLPFVMDVDAFSYTVLHTQDLEDQPDFTDARNGDQKDEEQRKPLNPIGHEVKLLRREREARAHAAGCIDAGGTEFAGCVALRTN